MNINEQVSNVIPRQQRQVHLCDVFLLIINGSDYIDIFLLFCDVEFTNVQRVTQTCNALAVHINASDFFVKKPILSDLAILCRLGL